MVAESPAVQLFLQCALAVDRALQIDAGVMQMAARICRALDGLPLAIELALGEYACETFQIAELREARPGLRGRGC